MLKHWNAGNRLILSMNDFCKVHKIVHTHEQVDDYNLHC